MGLGVHGLRIDPTNEKIIWEMMSKRLADPMFAIQNVSLLPFGSIPLFDYAIGSCSTVLDGIQLASDSCSLINSLWRSTFCINETELVFHGIKRSLLDLRRLPSQSFFFLLLFFILKEGTFFVPEKHHGNSIRIFG